MKSLKDKLLELKEIDETLQGLIDREDKGEIKEQWVELINETQKFQSLRDEIKADLLGKSVIEVRDNAAKLILSKISNNEDFFAESIIEIMEGNDSLREFIPLTISPQSETDYERLNEEKLDELAFSEFYSWFGPSIYFWNLLEIGVLIVDKKVHAKVEKFVDEARQCYAFERYNAVYSICRTMIEAALRDVGLRLGKIKYSSDSKKF